MKGTKYLAGQPVRVTGSERIVEIFTWDQKRGEYLIIWLNDNGFIESKEYFDENLITEVRGNELFGYIFDFSDQEIQFLKRHSNQMNDDEYYITLNITDLDWEEKQTLNSIRTRIDRHRISPFGQSSARINEFDFLHKFYKIDQINHTKVKIDKSKVRELLVFFKSDEEE